MLLPPHILNCACFFVFGLFYSIEFDNILYMDEEKPQEPIVVEMDLKIEPNDAMRDEDDESGRDDNEKDEIEDKDKKEGEKLEKVEDTGISVK